MNSRKVGYGIFDSLTKIIFIAVVAIVIIGGAKTAYYYGYNLFNQTAVYEGDGEGEQASITVEDGDSADEIAEKLASEGLIKDKRLFKMQEKFSEFSGKEKTGTYELSTKLTPEEMIAIMSGYEYDEDTGKWVEATTEDSSDATGNYDAADPAPEETEEDASEDEGEGEGEDAEEGESEESE